MRSGRMQSVIADRYMPRLNGLELFCSIQMDQRLKDTPFIMITMENDETKIEDALKQGIQHYLVKPFNAEVFDNKIQGVLQQPTSTHIRPLLQKNCRIQHPKKRVCPSKMVPLNNGNEDESHHCSFFYIYM